MALAVSRWYILVMLVWFLTGLPLLMLRWGFSGVSPFSPEGFIYLLRVNMSDSTTIIESGVGSFFIIMPIISLPFAVRFRRNKGLRR